MKSHNDSLKFSFGSKGTTLDKLSALVSGNYLCEQIIVPITKWREDKDRYLSDILSQFSGQMIVVRSSAASEDGWHASNAGAHLSKINIPVEPGAVSDAIESVFESYLETSSKDEVLIQPMIQNVAISGVVLTRDLDTGSPYYVLNYDDLSGRTDTVTGGHESKTMLIHRSHPEAIHSSRFRQLVNIVMELENVTDSHELDIEFCITDDESVFILQVRPLAARKMWQTLSDEPVDTAINSIASKISELNQPIDGLLGMGTIFGEMPDWNPAEMIGNAPRPLALSLYKHLITDHVWADARATMGYKHVPHPLLIDFCGRPYIDVRLSLNSFLPAGINSDFGARLIDYQLAALKEFPEYHDKIEFEIAITCRTFLFDQDRLKLSDANFSSKSIDGFESQISRITHDAIKSSPEGIEHLLKIARSLLSNNSDCEQQSIPAHVNKLLGECKDKGTLPFSILARHAFIGISLIRSLVERGIFTKEDMDRFIRSIRTIAAEFVLNMGDLREGHISTNTFLSRYGHLRPGTYDIMSKRYDSYPDLYLSQSGPVISINFEPFHLSAKQHNGIKQLLDEAGYSITPEMLLSYVAASVKAREEAKFYFTKNISDTLHLLAIWGEQNGFSREEISLIPINNFLEEPIDPGKLRDLAEEGKEKYLLTRAIRLPHIINEPDDTQVVRLPLGQPTFITSLNIVAPSVLLDQEQAQSVDDKVVMIESADPGFDWIFLHPIRGLVTCYGGANSHMAIRCAEFGLPAAIGCGERIFGNLKKANIIELNCAERKVTGH